MQLFYLIRHLKKSLLIPNPVLFRNKYDNQNYRKGRYNKYFITSEIAVNKQMRDSFLTSNLPY